MLSSLIALLLLWITGTVLLVLFTYDEDQSSRSRSRSTQTPSLGKKPPMENGYTGLGGEISRLEQKFEGQELELHRAAYLADHPHHDRVIRARDGALKFNRTLIPREED